MSRLRPALLVGSALLAATPALAQRYAAPAAGIDAHSPATLGSERIALPPGAAAAALAPGENAHTIAVSSLAGGPTTTLPNGTVVPAYWPGGPRPVNPAQFTFPNGQTVANVQGPGLARYASGYGRGHDGVARLLINVGSSPVGGCTGTLIGDRQLLTAAHCVSPSTLGVAPTSVDATFLGPNGTTRTIRASSINIMPGYTGSVVDQRDLAILTLDEEADAWITRYRVYNGNPLFKQVEFVGFGNTGNGVTGAIFSSQFESNPTRRVALNSYDLSRDAQFVYAANSPVTPILTADFDGADPGGLYPVARLNAAGQLVTGWGARTLAQNNTICRIFEGAGLNPTLNAKLCSEGYGLDEGFTGAGDSGGASFLVMPNGERMIVAVTSFGNVACFPDQRLAADGVTPAPRTDAGCPAGFVRYGSRFGMLNGHVQAGTGIQARFVSQFAPTAVVPEPATVLLVAGGLVAVAGVARRRRA